MCATAPVTETCPRAEKCRRLTPGTVTWRRVTGDVLFGVYRGGREGWGSRGRNGVSDAVAWLPLPAEVAPGRARPPWSPAEGWASPAISPGRVTVLGARPAAHAAQRLGGRGRVWPSAGDIGDRRRRLCARPPAPAPATRPATAQDRRDQERARGSGRGQPGGQAGGHAGGQPGVRPGVSPGSAPPPAHLPQPHSHFRFCFLIRNAGREPDEQPRGPARREGAGSQAAGQAKGCHLRRHGNGRP